MILTIVVSTILYTIIAVITSCYYKVYRAEWPYGDMDDLVLIGLFWPFYVAYCLARWPLSKLFSFMENKMRTFKEKPKKIEKVRVQVDHEQEEAEHEIEEMLASRRIYR